MAKQDRAIRTRRTILAAAASVFEERGYQAATITDILGMAGVTKGALYFHFQSKEDLAYGVMAEQGRQMIVPSRTCKVQEVVDIIILHTYRLQTDPMVRAGVRLTLDQQASDLNRASPFQDWVSVIADLFEQAQRQGELLPHVVPRETAEFLVGAYAGTQAMSQAISNYADLNQRVLVMLRHVLPNVVVSSVLTTIHLSPERGESIYAEAAEHADRAALADASA
ncbi:ScbR family autoregulator-binding transcription factor [Streptomyces sp. NPDC005963]|uniref:ScbR family autoregulator-binding transcription factor n=1 Tax=Streptomyces sp. NPDC005963 TaxID=3156721 RepID=UPI003403ABAB